MVVIGLPSGTSGDKSSWRRPHLLFLYQRSSKSTSFSIRCKVAEIVFVLLKSEFAAREAARIGKNQFLKRRNFYGCMQQSQKPETEVYLKLLKLLISQQNAIVLVRRCSEKSARDTLSKGPLSTTVNTSTCTEEVPALRVYRYQFAKSNDERGIIGDRALEIPETRGRARKNSRMKVKRRVERHRGERHARMGDVGKSHESSQRAWDSGHD
ncbi:hypothetical protein K0M31_015286 [Melipona bicolor]|uniref:Uncharacterized protein n=1 Tax=Melipona bicolor TaxID=60889 RepID=A0AA40FG50_9HYME|nr:hypothetical protein K0M31_015286 [Melipona bicolor]